jgi:hypothetical protein
MKTMPARPETMVNFITIPASIAGEVYEAPASVPSNTFVNSTNNPGSCLINSPIVIIEPQIIPIEIQ